MKHFYIDHDHNSRCREYLPKPKRSHKGLLSQCSHCGRLYICEWQYSDRYEWVETKIRNEGKND